MIVDCPLMPMLDSLLAAFDKQLAELGASRSARVLFEERQLRYKLETADENFDRQIRNQSWQKQRAARNNKQAKDCPSAKARPN